MKTTISTKQRIINTLLLNASFIENLGLMHGKMGIAIFFFHLARETNNAIYEDYAGELIDEIYEEISGNTPVDFENGLAGIGWGIEYLEQNGFIEANTDDVLEEFDNRILKQLIYTPSNELELLNGLIGIGVYLLKRIQKPHAKDDSLQTLTNKQALIHLIDELDRRTQDVSELIVEPQRVSNDVKQHQTISNPQTISSDFIQSSNLQTKGTTETISPHFDLLWDYPVLLWFLSELYEQNIFNFKVEKILYRFTELLIDNNNLTKLHSNRLLVVLALTKLHQTRETILQTKETIGTQGETGILNNFKQPLNVQAISNKFLSEIRRARLLSELPINNATFRFGAMGITWIYQQLYQLTDKEIYMQEALYWQQKGRNSNILDNEFAGYVLKNDANVFGILEGLTGIGLLSIPYSNIRQKASDNSQTLRNQQS